LVLSFPADRKSDRESGHFNHRLANAGFPIGRSAAVGNDNGNRSGGFGISWDCWNLDAIAESFNSLPKAEACVMHFPSPDRSDVAPDAAGGKEMKGGGVFANSPRGQKILFFPP
jgi:hypothetical protein